MTVENTQVMQKNRRQVYLEAMGIQQWVHRASQRRLEEERLAARLPSDAGVQDVEVDPSVDNLIELPAEVPITEVLITEVPITEVPVTEAPVAETASSAASTTALIESPSEPEITAPVASTVPSSTVSDSDSNSVSPFTSLYRCFDRGILVVAQLGDPFAPGFSAQEHVLFHNILLALGWQAGEMKTLKWPLESPLLSNDQTSMEIMLASFLNAQVQRSGVTTLVVFGAQVSVNFGRYFKDAVESPVTHLALPSLAELLRNPEQKAKVWGSLKSFCS